MKKQFLALLCALCLCLTGCSSLLSREYSYSAAHTEYPLSEKSAVLQADNYQGLVNAILYFITEHKETGIVRLTYTREEARVSGALDAACREVRGEDPLGAYAVEDIRYSVETGSDYCEVTVSISYAHTAEEVAAIAPLAGTSAIRQTVSAAMTTFSDECVFRVSYFTGDEDSLGQLVHQTWLDTPLAMARPGISISLYPDSGTNRIIEITLDWPEEQQILTDRSTALEKQALELLERTAIVSGKFTPQTLLSSLKWASIYDPEGEGSAYAALVQGRGNSLGYSQALRLLCQLSDQEATVAEGSLHGKAQYWLIVNTSKGYRHLDPTGTEPLYATDEDFIGAGYTWDTGRYPACVEINTFGEQPAGTDAARNQMPGGQVPQ